MFISFPAHFPGIGLPQSHECIVDDHPIEPRKKRTAHIELIDALIDCQKCVHDCVFGKLPITRNQESHPNGAELI